jgi:hypothetical protein
MRMNWVSYCLPSGRTLLGCICGDVPNLKKGS